MEASLALNSQQNGNVLSSSVSPLLFSSLSLKDQQQESSSSSTKELHIAPMLHYSTREFRQLLRILSNRVVLWTEMVVDETVQHVENLEEHLGYDANTHPIVCQIGGNSPDLCRKATSVILHRGYDEVNLNIDCPSERVSGKREFGAVLMKKAQLAKKILQEMQQNSTDEHKISVKCRIGVDNLDDLEFAASFIQALQPICHRFYLHARKCVLNGLMNARQNRSVPPLNFPRVYQLCHMFPNCEFWINGGIATLKEAKDIAYGKTTFEGCFNIKGDVGHQVPCSLCNLPFGSCTEPPAVAPPNLRGCMMGRAAMEDPCLFFNVDRYFYGEPFNPCQNRRQVLERYCNYLEGLYPRRCCDHNDEITYQYPPPTVEHEKEYCEQCIDIYGSSVVTEVVSGWSNPASTKKKGSKAVINNDQNTKQQMVKPKIASRIIARSLKPVQGMFHGVANGRAFRRCCDELGQNIVIRNCGPGFILRKAMKSVPADILDRDFEKI